MQTPWPDRRIQDLLAIQHPILQAPMAGAGRAALAIAVAKAGGLGAIPCALLTPSQIRDEVSTFRRATDRPLNLNFFCHQSPPPDPARESAWRARLAPYYQHFDISTETTIQPATRTPFDESLCDLVAELRPAVVSFHFGLPAPALVDRVRATGARVLASATTLDEARWLADHGCDAVIAQGAEAGGHRGMFLTTDTTTQIGTFALVPQMADAIQLPVIAAGGIADARGIVAALALGAAAVQLGTAYLLSPESTISTIHREALRTTPGHTTLTNVLTGRPARGIVNRAIRELGPLSDLAPAFPLAAAALAPLRAHAESTQSGDFSPLWSGQAAALARPLPAGELTRRLADETLARLAPRGPKPAEPELASISKDQVNELPLAHWDGPITLVSDLGTLATALEKLRAEPILGFDTESRPSFRPDEDHPVSLLQLASADHVYLFQLPWLGDLADLYTLLEDPNILKAGVAIRDDIKKLQKRRPFTPQNFIDIGHLSRDQNVRNTGLRTMSAMFLGLRISKGARTSNWSRRDLTEPQMRYAATDAWISRRLYLKMQELAKPRAS